MNLQTLNATDAEKIFGNFTNAYGQTITIGNAVHFTTAVGSVNGNLAVGTRDVSVRTFAGIAISDVADNAGGLYQCYGYNGSVYYLAEQSSLSLTADHALGPGDTASIGVGVTGVTFALGPVILCVSLGAVIRSAGGYVTGFIRAM